MLRTIKNITLIAMATTAFLFGQVAHAASETSTLLPSGMYLQSGGKVSKQVVDTLALYDATTQQTTALNLKLATPRVGHSATVLPDGTILILGGLGQDGYPVRSAEIIDLAAQTVQTIADTGLMARSQQRATLLTDGRVLITGGLSASGRPIAQAELWNSKTRQAESLHANLLTARYNHIAQLLAGSPVLIEGGQDASGTALASSELYDTQGQSFTVANGVTVPDSTLAPAIAEIIPPADSFDVAVDSWIVVRFNKPLKVDTINTATVTLLGPNGLVKIKAVPAENGMLLFITPQQDLQPASQYTLFLNGITDTQGQAMLFKASSFHTASLNTPNSSTGTNASTGNNTVAGSNSTRPVGDASGQGSSASTQQSSTAATQGAINATANVVANIQTAPDDERWIPGPQQYTGKWRSGRAPSPLRDLTLLTAPKKITALSGQVLALNGKPLAGVALRIGDKRAMSDDTGRFLLQNVPTGDQVLVINGYTAHDPHGYFEAKVTISPGFTNFLGYTIWLPKLDMAHAVKLSSPTKAEVVITNPQIPGLELHLPAGTVIRDHRGKIVTEISITPIPTDRPPFPLPNGVKVPIYFTVQPGGSHLASIDPKTFHGAQLIYPNFLNKPAGSEVPFWNYDPIQRGWFVYGHGHVSADGRQVLPDPGVAIYEFTGAMIGAACESTDPADFGIGDGDGDECGPPAPPPPPTAPPPYNCQNNAGDPVDCALGLFSHTRTDIFLKDTVPFAFTRTYRSQDTAVRALGAGTEHNYGMYIRWSAATTSAPEQFIWVRSDGSQIAFPKVPGSGTTFSNSTYQVTTVPGALGGATIKWNAASSAYELTTRDRSQTYQFDQQTLVLVGVKGAGSDALSIAYSNTLLPTLFTTPHGRWAAVTYDGANRVSKLTDNVGRTVSYTYDASGNLSSVTDANGGTESYTYDANHNMLTVVDPRGNTMVTNVYDPVLADHPVIKQTLADGAVFSFTYNFSTPTPATGYVPVHMSTDVTDPNGNVTRKIFSTDPSASVAGTVASIVPTSPYLIAETQAEGTPLARTTSYMRDTANRITSITDPLGRVSSYTYDANGNMVSVTQLSGTPGAVTTNYNYDPVWNKVASTTDPLGHTTTLSYDAAGNLALVTDPLGNNTNITYDASARPLNISVSAGSQTLSTLYTYDGGDLTAITDSLGRVRSFFADSLGRTVVARDPLGNTAFTSYDNLDRPTVNTDALNHVTTLSYDANGNPLSITDANGNKTNYTYDSRNRVATHTDPLLKTDAYGYDLNGNLKLLTDRKGQVTSRLFDNLNRVTQVTYADGRIVGYTYDAGDRLTQIVDSVSGTISYNYDGLDRVISETTPQGTVSYTYDAAGRRTGMTVAGQPSVSYSYDAANRLTQITQGANTVSFTYDGAGRRTSMILPNGILASYGYDAASQLTSLTYTKGMLLIGDLTYTYDDAGRRVQMGGSLAKANMPAPMTAAYDAANRLTQFNARSLSYDNNGNLINDGLRNYAWDAANRLTLLSGTANATFQYDPLGRRVAKTVNGVQTGFVYDGVNPVQELSGATPTANLLTGGLDEVFIRTDSSGAQNYLVDALGSVLALTDATGALATQYSYEPYGGTTASGAASSNAFQYTGRENDGTGLYLYRARYYDPELSRFISSDPIGLAGGINTYGYVGGNPVSAIDPLGLAMWWNGSNSWTDVPNGPGWEPYTPGGPQAPCESGSGSSVPPSTPPPSVPAPLPQWVDPAPTNWGTFFPTKIGGWKGFGACAAEKFGVGAAVHVGAEAAAHGIKSTFPGIASRIGPVAELYGTWEFFHGLPTCAIEATSPVPNPNYQPQ